MVHVDFADLNKHDPDRTFTFGKYKGRRVRDIISVDPEYVSWASWNVEWFELDAEEISLLHEVTRSYLRTAMVCGYDPFWDWTKRLPDKVVKSYEETSWTGATLLIEEYASGKTRETVISLNDGSDYDDRW
jgi:hypothetical protein